MEKALYCVNYARKCMHVSKYMYVRTYVCKLCLLVTTQQDESGSLAPKLGKQFQGGECLILKAKKAQEGKNYPTSDYGSLLYLTRSFWVIMGKTPF